MLTTSGKADSRNNLARSRDANLLLLCLALFSANDAERLLEDSNRFKRFVQVGIVLHTTISHGR